MITNIHKLILDTSLYIFGNIGCDILLFAFEQIMLINKQILMLYLKNGVSVNDRIDLNNCFPCVLVAGFAGYVKKQKHREFLKNDTFDYWGAYSMKDFFQMHQTRNKAPCFHCDTMSPIGSNKLKAIELFHYIKGGKPDTKKYFDKNVSRKRWKVRKGICKKWNSKNKIHLVGHSQGGATIQYLIIMLHKKQIVYLEKNPETTAKKLKSNKIIRKKNGQLYYNTSPAWLASRTSLSGAHYGSYLVSVVCNWEKHEHSKYMIGDQIITYKFISYIVETLVSIALYSNLKIKNNKLAKLWDFGYDLMGVSHKEIDELGMFNCFKVQKYLKTLNKNQVFSTGLSTEQCGKEAKLYWKCYNESKALRDILEIAVITKNVSDMSPLIPALGTSLISLMMIFVRYNLVQSINLPYNDGILPFKTQQTVYSRESNTDITQANKYYYNHAHCKFYKHPIDIILPRTDHMTFMTFSSVLNSKRKFYVYEYIYTMMKSIPASTSP